MDDFATRPDPHTVQFVRILPGPIEHIWDLSAGRQEARRMVRLRRPCRPKSARASTCASSTAPCRPTRRRRRKRFIEMDKTGHSSEQHAAGAMSRRIGWSSPSGRKARDRFGSGIPPDPGRRPRTIRFASPSPTARFPTATMRWVCPAAGTAIWPSCKTRRKAKCRRPSGMCGGNMTASTTSAIPEPGSLLSSGPVRGAAHEKNSRRRDHRACLSLRLRPISCTMLRAIWLPLLIQLVVVLAADAQQMALLFGRDAGPGSFGRHPGRSGAAAVLPGRDPVLRAVSWRPWKLALGCPPRIRWFYFPSGRTDVAADWAASWLASAPSSPLVG